MRKKRPTDREIELDARDAALRSREQQVLVSADITVLREFYITEYESLRAEILQTLADSRNLERNVVFAIAVSLARIMTHKNLPELVWFIPLVLVLLGVLRSTALLFSFGRYAEYIRLSENYLTNAGSPPGWETFRKDKSLGIFATAFVFWLVLLLASGFVIYRKPTVNADSNPTAQIIMQGTTSAAPSLISNK